MELHKLHKQRTSIRAHPPGSGLLLTITLNVSSNFARSKWVHFSVSSSPTRNLCPASSEWVWLAHKRSQTASLKESPGPPRDARVMGPGPTLYTAALGLVSNTSLSPLQKAHSKQWCLEKGESAGDCVWHKGCHSIHCGLGWDGWEGEEEAWGEWHKAACAEVTAATSWFSRGSWLERVQSQSFHSSLLHLLAALCRAGGGLQRDQQNLREGR